MRKKIFIWCCDINNRSGEGILALKFIKDLKKYNLKYNFKIISPSNKKISYLKNLFGRIVEIFFIPLTGVLYLWFIFLFKKNKKVCYVNYLPLWNFIIFLTLPPNTILGPITGGSKYKNLLLDRLIRGFLFKIFYQISILILNLRQKKILFTTDLLKKNSKLYSKKKFFNYVFKDFKNENKKIKKKYDLILYLRNHKNKNTDLMLKFIEKLNDNYKILTVGKKIIKKNVLNLGQISQKKLYKFMKKTKYAIVSTENLYSFFCIDCLKNGIHVIFNKGTNPIKEVKNNMTGVDYYNFPIDKIQNILNKKYKRSKKIIFKKKKYFDNYFKI